MLGLEDGGWVSHGDAEGHPPQARRDNPQRQARAYWMSIEHEDNGKKHENELYTESEIGGTEGKSLIRSGRQDPVRASVPTERSPVSARQSDEEHTKTTSAPRRIAHLGSERWCRREQSFGKRPKKPEIPGGIKAWGRKIRTAPKGGAGRIFTKRQRAKKGHGRKVKDLSSCPKKL